MGFPEGFVWGAAAASYQIEGGAADDGKGPSVWDMLCDWPGKVFNGDSGAVGCDHYHRYREDVALMKDMGLQAYRLSISWPRVLPEGTGAVNAAGLDFYDRLIDELLAAGIEPYITLFHWDYPYASYLRGGWLNPDSPDWFAAYADVITRQLGDRVKHWMTLNEPAVFVVAGHFDGRHAPGLQLPKRQINQIAHHVLLAHGKAAQVLRANVPGSVLGIALNGGTPYPASDSPEDIEAARLAMFGVHPEVPYWWQHSFWADPMLRGEYTEGLLDLMGADAPDIHPGDMETIQQPLDFYGMNIYTGPEIRAGENGMPELVQPPTGHPVTLFHWVVAPEALYWGPRFAYERYGLPIYITENGLSNPDWVSLDGKVHDPQRIDHMHRYLRQFRKAGEDGAKIGGYFHWSVMDNFEWAEGMKHRFGLIHVDYQTLKRTVKDFGVLVSGRDPE